MNNNRNTHGRKGIMQSKWFAIVELSTSIIVLAVAIFMLIGREPSYKEVQKTYSSMVEDLTIRNTDINRYNVFGQRAAQEGNIALERLYAAGANGQRSVLEKEYNMMNKIMERSMPNGSSIEAKDGEEGLMLVIDNEKHKEATIYPRYKKSAEEEKFNKGIDLFDKSKRASDANRQLFEKVAEEKDFKKDIKAFACYECGCIYKDEAPTKCQICGADKNNIK